MGFVLQYGYGGTLFRSVAILSPNPKRLYRAMRIPAYTTWVSTPSFAQSASVEQTFEKRASESATFLFCGEKIEKEKEERKESVKGERRKGCG